MYGIHINIMFNQKTVEVQTQMESVKETVNVSENVLVEDIRSLCDVDCHPHITNKTRKSEMELIMKGSLWWIFILKQAII